MSDVVIGIMLIGFCLFVFFSIIFEDVVKAGLFVNDRFSTKELMKSATRLLKSIKYNLPITLEDLQDYSKLLERDEKKLQMIVESLKIIEVGDNNKAVNDLKTTRDGLHKKILKNKEMIKGLIVELTNTKLLGLDDYTDLHNFNRNTEELRQYNQDLRESFKEVSSL